MPEKKKKNKNDIKVRKHDLKLRKDPKGGLVRPSRTRQDVAGRVW